MKSILLSLFKFVSSIKMAVPVVLALAASLATATILESLYDTLTSQYYVYRAPWFNVLLSLFGVNIFFVAMSRWPWKSRHIPFLSAHLGILLLLLGSYITQKHGVDGMVRINEGRSENVVEIDIHKLYFSREGVTTSYILPKFPPLVDVKPIPVPEFGLQVERYISHADYDVRFEADDSNPPDAFPAVRLQLKGGPMQVQQDFWMWAGDRTQAYAQAGPAILILTTPGQLSAPMLKEQGVWFELELKGDPRKPDSEWILRNITAKGQKPIETKVRTRDLKGFAYDPKWKGKISLTVQEVIPQAKRVLNWKEAHEQFGERAPPPAILLKTTGTPASEIWLGLGERAALKTPQGDVGISFVPQQEKLPFSLRLDRFDIDRYHGTQDPSEYSSKVTVLDPRGTPSSSRISMNTPLSHGGFTFYQSSYEDAQPRPTISIFSVNKDPGRSTKYVGSIFLVLGIVLLFAQRLRLKKPVITQPEVKL